MTKDPDQPAGTSVTENSGGFLTGFIAEEHVFDRRAAFRLVSWGVTTLAAVSVAMVASQSSVATRHDLVTEDDLSRQEQQIQILTRENKNETRRLASAIDTLNGDRDRLFSRMTTIEQNLESVTSAVPRQNSGAASSQALAPALPAPTLQSPAPAQLTTPMAATAAKPSASSIPPRQNAAATSSSAAATASNTPSAPANAPSETQSALATMATTPVSTATMRQTAPSPQLADSAAVTEEPPAASAAQPPSPPSATAAKARQGAAQSPQPVASATGKPAAPSPSPAPTVSPVATIAAGPGERRPDVPVEKTDATTASSPQLMASQSTMLAPGAAAGKLIEPVKSAEAEAPPEEVASVAADLGSSEATASRLAVRRTEFAVDVGGASSVGGLRAMWRGILKSNPALAKLTPIIMVKEASGGLGMQLRLAAGPLDNAAAAAKICAALTESQRSCQPTVFDGQHLALTTEQRPADPRSVDAKALVGKSMAHKKTSSHRIATDDPPKAPETPTLSSMFGRH